jgi:foldase protein PrsA
MTRTILFCTLVLSLGVLMSASAQQPAAPANSVAAQKPVAIVNSHVIGEAEYIKTLQDWFGKEVLEEMIQSEIIAQAAERAKVTATDEQVDTRVRALQNSMDEQARTGDGLPFAAWLASRRMTLANLRARLRTDILLEGLVADQAKVTEGEVRDYYDQNKQRYSEPERVKIAVLTLKTEDEAKRVRDLVVSGKKPWGDAVRDFSINPYTVKTGGEVGYIPDDGSPIAKAAFDLKKDMDISQPVLFQGAYHLIRRDDRATARVAPLDEVKQQIAAMLLEQRLLDLKMKKRDELRSQANIQRYLEFSDTRPATGD